MAIVVHPLSKQFQIAIEAGGEKLIFNFKQLDFKTKSMINAETTKFEKGELYFDAPKTSYLNLKHSLLSIEGLVDENGENYKVVRDENGVVDECLDELLNTSFTDELLYTAQSLGRGIPTEILNPATGKALDGVSVVPQDVGTVKKKS